MAPYCPLYKIQTSPKGPHDLAPTDPDLFSPPSQPPTPCSLFLKPPKLLCLRAFVLAPLPQPGMLSLLTTPLSFSAFYFKTFRLNVHIISFFKIIVFSLLLPSNTTLCFHTFRVLLPMNS